MTAVKHSPWRLYCKAVRQRPDKAERVSFYFSFLNN